LFDENEVRDQEGGMFSGGPEGASRDEKWVVWRRDRWMGSNATMLKARFL
jgi:hypothetical protein